MNPMRMSRVPFAKAAVLGCGLIVAIAGNGNGNGNGNGEKEKPRQQKQAPLAKTAQDQERVPAASGKAKKPARRAKQNGNREERRSRQYVATTFPRTRNLLAYLQKSDPAAYQSVLVHSAKLVNRREAIALRLAHDHHPELAKLLRRLRRQKPRSYKSAIRELVADYARLVRAQQRSQKEYEVALREWKIRSQVRLVAARTAVDKRPRLQNELASLLIQGEVANRRLIQMQIERYQAQIDRLQRRLQRDPRKTVERQLRAINDQANKKSKRRRKK